MAIIDNTLAAQVPQFNPATPLMQAAKIQEAQAEAQANQYKQNQTEMGAEMRGLQPFVNTPEFPAKWREAADKLRQRGVINDQMHEQWANAPSPLLMKSIISKTEDPALSFRKDEAKREQGNTDRSFGLQKTNADRTYGLAARAADRADDPTPTDFEENPLAKTDPTQPSYRPLSGGPKDPNYLAATARAEAVAKGDAPRIVAPNESIVIPNSGEVKYENKNRASSTESAIPEETLRLIAGRALAGEKGYKSGYGKGIQGPADIRAIDNMVSKMAGEQGLSSNDLVQRGIDLVGDTSRERTASNMEGKMTPASIEAHGAFKIAREAADNLPRTDFVPYNKLVQMGQAAWSDPRLKKVLVAYNTAVMTYSRAVNPSGVGTVDSQQHAREILQAADGPEATKAAFDQLDREVEMAHASPAQARAGFKKERADRLGASSRPSAKDRFSQLTGTGLSKDEAYVKMHEEGY